MSNDDPTLFFIRPISLLLMIATVILIVWPVRDCRKKRKTEERVFNAVAS